MEGQVLSSAPQTTFPLDGGTDQRQIAQQDDSVCLLSLMGDGNPMTRSSERRSNDPDVLEFDPAILDVSTSLAMAGRRSPISQQNEAVEELNFAPEAAESTVLASHREGHGDRHRHRNRRPDAKTELNKDIPPESSLRDGDIIFVSNSNFDEGKAIQKVSNSPLTHCGVLFKEGDDWYVYEAVQPVTKTKLKDFHKPDSGETYIVSRLRDADTTLTPKVLQKLHDNLKDQVGKDYDHLFGWGNDKLYCSELVWKAFYETTRLKVGEVKMIGDFDLSDPLVKKLVEQRYGKNVPITEPTITPGGVYDSRLLRNIHR